VTQQPPGKPPLRGLGRGLDALLPARPPPRPNPDAPSYGDGNVFRCAIEKIAPQVGQPRQNFDSSKLDELADSIKEHGLLEPLVVRRRPGTDVFEIIAGERRWRASQRAGLKELLVVVRDVSAHDAFELALVENVQREDLDAIEFAEALDRLIREHGYTQDTLARRVGKDRSTIANALRLLKLPEKIRSLVVQGELSEGHARALLGAADEKTLAQLADKVVRGHLSVRQTEQLVRASRPSGKGSTSGGGGKPGSAGQNRSASVRDLEARLTRHLGTRTQVLDKEGKGQILIDYASLDELDRLLEILL
jgi:ParB family transcriptional regulator, chromosome partitioning protein